MNQQISQLRAKCCSLSVVNEMKGAMYHNDDITLFDIQFDLLWEEVYGYHPKNLPDYWS